MSTYERPESSACPHDGWYNGNPKLMIENGTYDDFRDRLVALVEAGKMNKAIIAQCDKEWESIPLAEKKRRRDAVVADSTPVPVRDKEGKVEMRAKPSDNGAPTRRNNADKQHLSVRRAKGALTTKNDPISRQMAEQEAKAKAKAPAAKTAEPKTGNVPPAANPAPQGQGVSREDAMAMGAKPIPQS